jgi:hypothetical protein
MGFKFKFNAERNWLGKVKEIIKEGFYINYDNGIALQ